MTHEEARLLKPGDKIRIIMVARGGDESYIDRELEVKELINSEYHGVELTTIVTADSPVHDMQWSPEYVEAVIS